MSMHSLGQRLKSAATRYQSPLSGNMVARRRRLVSPKARQSGRLPHHSGDHAAQSHGAIANLDRRNRLEAVLVLAREPQSLRKLAQLANLIDGTEARTLMSQLRRRYDERGCAFQWEEVAGGYQLLTRPKFASWLRSLGATEPDARFSPPALETLAVVAYRQPVLRAEVEAIRGVACGEILRQLMDRDLLRIVGRSEELGRPLRYGTTKHFLRTFGLCSLDELPLASELRRKVGENDRADEAKTIASTCSDDLTGDAEAA